MPIDTSQLPYAKPEPRKKATASERRKGRVVVQDVRLTCVERDRYCRLYVLDASLRRDLWQMFGQCSGRSEWAHFGAKRRSHTRGQEAVIRHTTAGSLMLCEVHHRTGEAAYDLHRMTIEALTDRGCDGPLRFARDGKTWTESE